MAGAFLWDDKVGAANSLTAVAGGAVDTMPLSNLLDPQPRLRARLLGSAASVLVDLGANAAIEAAALISTSLPGAATVRWRVGPAESLVEAAPEFDMRFTDTGGPVYPSGWLFNRASSGWCIDATGSLVEVAADTPRIDHDPVTLAPRGLLLEEARTNSVPNPRAAGASGPSTWPTGWNFTNGTGLTVTINGTGVENGFPYIEFRISGTATATANMSLSFVSPTATVAASVGQVWTASLYAKVTGGSGAGFSTAALYITGYDASSVIITNVGALLGYTAAPLGRYRLTVTGTLSHASTAYVRPRLQFNVNSGAVVDVTLRVAVPQLELAGVASSPILPPVGTPGASTRAVDRARVTGLSFSGGFSLLVRGGVSGGATQTLIPGGVGPDNDSSNSSYLAIGGAYPGPGNAYSVALSGGVGFNPTGHIVGTMGQADTFVLAADGGGVTFARNGGVLTNTAAWSLPAGLDRVSLGGAPWGGPTTGNPAVGVGWYQRFALYTTRLLDTQATALCTTGSSLVAAALTHDSGTIPANTSDSAGGNVVLLRDTAATGRYLQVDMATSGAGFIDIGRIIAGPLWRVAHSHAYGISEGRLMLDRRDRNPLTGAEFPVPAVVNPRVARFTLPLLSAAEVIGQHRSMVATVGAAGDVLWIPETSLSQAELNQRSLYGAAAGAGDDAAPSRDSPAASSRAFRIVERV